MFPRRKESVASQKTFWALYFPVSVKKNIPTRSYMINHPITGLFGPCDRHSRFRRAVPCAVRTRRDAARLGRRASARCAGGRAAASAHGTMGGCVRVPTARGSRLATSGDMIVQLQLGCTSPIMGARIHLCMRHACLMNHPCPGCVALRRAALGVPARWLAGLEHPHVNPLDQTLHHAPASPALVEPGMRAWLREGRRSRQALASVLRKRKKP